LLLKSKAGVAAGTCQRHKRMLRVLAADSLDVKVTLVDWAPVLGEYHSKRVRVERQAPRTRFVLI
jgi:hypothetical protein